MLIIMKVDTERKMIMAEYIEREDAIQAVKHAWAKGLEPSQYLEIIPADDVAPVRHGRWILEAHDERVNYRWNVTAECSECCDEQKEIWAGFFPNVPPSIARDVALVSAESVKLSNYCPNCGAKMDSEDSQCDT